MRLVRNINELRQKRREPSPIMEMSWGHGDLGDSEIGSRISKVESLSRRPPAPICVKASVLRKTQARLNSLPGCAIALRRPRRLCAATGTQRHQLVLGSAPHQSSRKTTSEGRVRPCVSTPMCAIMCKRQRTLESRFVACAPVPRDSLEYCGLRDSDPATTEANGMRPSSLDIESVRALSSRVGASPA